MRGVLGMYYKGSRRVLVTWRAKSAGPDLGDGSGHLLLDLLRRLIRVVRGFGDGLLCHLACLHRRLCV